LHFAAALSDAVVVDELGAADERSCSARDGREDGLIAQGEKGSYPSRAATAAASAASSGQSLASGVRA
jgi:hypothetical protein